MNKKSNYKIIRTIALSIFGMAFFALSAFVIFSNPGKNTVSVSAAPNTLTAPMPNAIVKMSFENDMVISSEESAKFGTHTALLATGDTSSITKFTDNGKAGKGIQFKRGTASSTSLTDGVRIPNKFSGGIKNSLVPKNDNFTFSTWINMTAYSTDGSASTVLEQISGESMIYIDGTGSNHGYLFFVYDAGSTKSSVQMPLDGWHQIAMTITTNGTIGTVKGYLDGVQVAARSWTWSSSFSGTGDFILGQYRNGGRSIDATFDEVYFYDEALTPEQIEYSYYYSGMSFSDKYNGLNFSEDTRLDNYELPPYNTPSVEKIVYVGGALELPEKIKVWLKNGDTIMLPVTYNISGINLNAVGTYLVPATVDTGAFLVSNDFISAFNAVVNVRNIPYSITYHLDGGVNSGNNPLQYDVATETIILADATKEGYNFIGWYDGAGTDAVKVAQIATGKTGNIVLYARFEEIVIVEPAVTYTIIYDANGGSGSMDNSAFASGEEQALSANSFTRKKYKFTGWNTKADGSGKAYSDSASITVTENITLYAMWEKTSGCNKGSSNAALLLILLPVAGLIKRKPF